MNSKDKAKELVEKMFSLSTTNAFPAKQCALIAVNELLNHCYEVMKPFWEEVKIEIEKI
jgi:hypothetical protein